MVKYKMQVLNRTVDLSNKKKEELLNQLQTDLKPVLHQDDFEKFDFEEAWNWLKTLEEKISVTIKIIQKEESSFSKISEYRKVFTIWKSNLD